MARHPKPLMSAPLIEWILSLPVTVRAEPSVMEAAPATSSNVVSDYINGQYIN